MPTCFSPFFTSLRQQIEKETAAKVNDSSLPPCDQNAAVLLGLGQLYSLMGTLELLSSGRDPACSNELAEEGKRLGEDQVYFKRLLSGTACACKLWRKAQEKSAAGSPTPSESASSAY